MSVSDLLGYVGFFLIFVPMVVGPFIIIPLIILYNTACACYRCHQEWRNREYHKWLDEEAEIVAKTWKWEKGKLVPRY